MDASSEPPHQQPPQLPPPPAAAAVARSERRWSPALVVAIATSVVLIAAGVGWAIDRSGSGSPGPAPYPVASAERLAPNWPTPEAESFLSHCVATGGGMVAYCECAAQRLSARYPDVWQLLREIERYDSPEDAFQRSPALHAVVLACLNAGASEGT
jgi:hypothetical protein